MKKLANLYSEIIDTKNLFLAWHVFRKNKKKKRDVLAFEWALEENIFALNRELSAQTYRHGPYTGFYITDPKRRHIHKAIVRDRVLHHAIYSKLYILYDPTFIDTSFSCRNNRGTHKGVEWLTCAVRRVSANYTKPCYVLKCDIQKFFDSVDHGILLGILKRRIRDQQVRWLLDEIVESYVSDRTNLFERKGLPIGNLTSQLFANIYMNEFDQFVKHTLRIKHYARYTDDFVVVSEDRGYLSELIPTFSEYLHDQLKLTLHPDKVDIHALHAGVDFLGYVILPRYRVVRTKTKKRMYRGLKRRVRECRRGSISPETTPKQALLSYLGTLSHADAFSVSEDLLNHYWFLLSSFDS
jgi:retron-type reverse transcriptase